MYFGGRTVGRGGMIVPYPALEAYRRDLAATPGRASFGDADAYWLAVTQGLWRVAQLPPDERRSALETFAGSLAAAGEPDLETLRAAMAGLLDDDPDALAITAVLRWAAAVERAGALHVAYSALAALRELVPERHHRAHGLILAQQGRISREVGDLSTAADLYAQAERAGRECDDAEVTVRSVLGQGVLAVIRGNYPAARAHFRRALGVAKTHGLQVHASAAHHGLLRAALAAGNLEAALLHGWDAFRNAGGDRHRQADMLVNLGEVCLLVSRPAAALRAYRTALRLTSLPSIRLGALGGAVIAAARLGDRGALDELSHETEQTFSHVAEGYEHAVTMVELAEAFAILGDAPRRDVYRTRALQLAEERGFYEVVHRAETITRGAATTKEARRPPTLSDGAVGVLRAIESLDPSASAAASR
jgi:tetratricopeptide (TPR) repeat protein